MSNLKLSFNKIENNIHFDEINYERKMRLNISSFALSVIENDTFIYGYSTNGSVLNAIFRNMREYYSENDQENDDVFVYNSYKKARDDLMSITKKEDVLNEHLHKVCDRLQNYIDNLLLYPGENSCLIVVASDNYSYLTEECNEAVCYGKYAMSKFFRCVIESYARKTHLERERIMTNKTTEEIYHAIKDGHMLKISTGKKTRMRQDTFLVKPYRIITDPLAAYLVCMSKNIKNDNEEYIIASFRISRIDSVKETKKVSFISKESVQNIEKALKERGVKYLLSESTMVEVMLTPNGLNIYNNVLSNRPLAESTGNIESDGRTKLSFICTEKQAEDYFFGFGAEAEIISPPKLRKRMLKKYTASLSVYEG